ncbi:hypothetical protein QQ008_10390 [Fulvivirgaceae bacterium BMA10]|uniref:Adhesin domain-containing protein n=1 Tax=Splendidivirga corallicola TaxID=3051826 RepID=A0ABT8KM27_9BACT|nr:hypothetical protein [Fulvivirgaceae bacterium BMA10]
MPQINLFFIAILFWINVQVLAQTKIDQSVATAPNQSVYLDMVHPKLINITTWEKSEISIQGTVSINKGENDSNFKINTENIGNELRIISLIEDYDNLPRKIKIRKGGTDYYFDTDDWNHPLIKNFYKEHGHEQIEWSSHGVIKDIKLEIKVPNNIALNVYSKNGIIEIKGFSGVLTANSKNGAVDVTIASSSRNKFNLKTKWGEIYTNLDVDIQKRQKGDNKWNEIACSLNGGSGSLMSLESKNGNVYLRSAQ